MSFHNQYNIPQIFSQFSQHDQSPHRRASVIFQLVCGSQVRKSVSAPHLHLRNFTMYIEVRLILVQEGGQLPFRWGSTPIHILLLHLLWVSAGLAPGSDQKFVCISLHKSAQRSVCASRSSLTICMVILYFKEQKFLHPEFYNNICS